MSVNGLLNTTVNIATETQTKSAAGFVSAPILTTVTSNVPARVSDQTPDRAMTIYGKYDAERMKRIAFGSNPNLTSAKSWIIWNGRNYSVTSVQNAGGNMDVVWFVDCIDKPFGG